MYCIGDWRIERWIHYHWRFTPFNSGLLSHRQHETNQRKRNNNWFQELKTETKSKSERQQGRRRRRDKIIFSVRHFMRWKHLQCGRRRTLAEQKLNNNCSSENTYYGAHGWLRPVHIFMVYRWDTIWFDYLLWLYDIDGEDVGDGSAMCWMSMYIYDIILFLSPSRLIHIIISFFFSYVK